MAQGGTPPRVFISFARENADHIEAVRKFCDVLRENGVDAVLDEQVGPQVWPKWMADWIKADGYILMIASPKYKLHAEGGGPLTEGRGVRFESRLVADKLYNEDDAAFVKQVLPVVLPGRSADELPYWMTPRSRAYFEVDDFTAEGIDRILRHIFDIPYNSPRGLGPPPAFLTREQEQALIKGEPPDQRLVAEDIPAEFTRALNTFEGRREALGEIARWLGEVDDRSSRFIASGPGSGKTALLGLVAHLGGGYEVRVGVSLPEECVPPKNSIDIALYARNMVPGTILARLAQAADMPAGEIATIVSARNLAEGRASLVSHLRARGKRMTVLLDALDEESVPEEGEEESSPRELEELCCDLLKPLVTDPDSPVRLLLGGRAQVLPLAGFGPAGKDDRIIDLDSRYQDREALREWAGTVLRGSDPQSEGAPDHYSPWRRARDTDFETALDEIVQIAGPSFYVGEAIARAQARLPELPDPNSAQWKAELPQDAGPAMRTDLQARLPTASLAQRAMDLLLPLAYGRGDGIPWAEVWLPLANALRPPGAKPYRDIDLQWIRTHASSYVVESPSDQPGRPLFRLYHRSLGRYLTRDERYSQRKHDQAGDEHTIVRTLLDRVRMLPDGRRDWAGASAYLRTHLLEHAVTSGRLADIDELVLDAAFLANGRDAELRAALGKLTEPRHQAVADAYSSALAALLARRGEAAIVSPRDGRSPDDVRALLAQLSLAARCRGVDALARPIRLGTGPGEAPWHATWAAWRQQPPQVRLVGHTDRVLAIVTATLADGRVVAVTAGDDGGVRIWDVLRGVLVLDIPRAHNGSVLGLAVGRLSAGKAIVVSTGDDRAARVWDLNTGDLVAEPFTQHESPIHSVAVAELSRGLMVITGDERGTVRVWDPQTGREPRAPYELQRMVTAIALVRLKAATHVVSAHDNGDIQAWSLAPRSPRISAYSWHGTRAVRALAVGELDERPVVVSAGDDGAVYRWDPMTDSTSQDALRGPLAVHTGGIWALAIAEVDGRPAIVSAGADRTARVWDLVDGAPIGAPFTGHTSTIRALATTEAGNRAIVISGGDDLMPRIWDLTAAGTANEPFTGHRARVRSLLFIQMNGRNRLVSGSSDATVRRWDPDTGALMGYVLKGHRRWVGALAIADVAGRACILSGGADTTVRIQDAASGEEVRRPVRHPDGVTALLATSIGAVTRVVSACLDGTVVVWDPETGEETARYLGHKGPDGARRSVWALRTVWLDRAGPDPLVLSAGVGGALHVWRPASGEALLVEPSGHQNVTALTNVPAQPSQIASGGDDGVIRVRDLATTGRSVEWRRHPTASAIHALALESAGASMIIVSAHADGTVQFCDIADPRQVSSHRGHEGHARVLAQGTAGGRPAIFSGGDDAMIRVWDVERKAPLRTLHRSWVRSLAVIASPGIEPHAEEWMVVSGSDDDTIQIRGLSWDRTPRERVIQAHHGGVRALAVSPAEPPVIVSGGVDHRLKVWDPATGQQLGTLPGHRDWIRALATGTLPGVGPVAVSASGDGHVGVWDLDRMVAIGAPRNLHPRGVRAVGIAEISGDPRPVVVSGSTDSAVVVSMLATGERIGERFAGHRSGVRALAVTSLAKMTVVISGDDDGVVLAWDLKTRELVGDVPHGPGEVNAIAAQQRGYRGDGCTWVAVAAGETVTLSSWTTERHWQERATAHFGCEVLGAAMPHEFWQDEPPGHLVIGATHGVVVLRFADPA
jgi:WD40 repeat protein